MERKLAAILAADAVGYSRLVAKDEDEALALFKRCAAIIEERIRQHHGRIFGGAGDSVIAEFQSPVEALRCALEFQHQLEQLDEKLSADWRMQFRVGINLGDVVVESNNLFGEAVNIAARLESLAEPGGIFVSGSLHEQVKHLPNVIFEDLGERRLKNIPIPVHIYGLRDPGRTRRLHLRFPLWKTAAGLALVATPAVFLISPDWWKRLPAETTTESQARQFTVPPQPSIAVLPLNNVSADRSGDYFSDGITNDITTDLSKFAGLFVVANNSASTFKGKPTKVQDIGSTLGVRYVLEGTVQKTPERLRVNVQLIDAGTGHHLWAERYDRSLGDAIAIQEDITRHIVAALAVKVSSAEAQRVNRKLATNMDAYDFYLKGKQIWADPGKVTPEGNHEARQLFEKAVERDPNYAAAYAELAYVYVRDYQNGWSPDGQASLRKAEELAKKSIELDDNFSSHWYLAIVAWNQGNFDKSFYEYETARQINPNDPDLAADMAEALVYGGEPERAIEQIKAAMARYPGFPYWYWWNLGRAYYMARQYTEAIDAIGRINSPPNDVRLITAASEAQRGNIAAAKSIMSEFSKNDPDWSVEKSAAYYYRKASDREHWLDGLRKAGLKER